MDRQQEQRRPSSDRPSFFGLPASVRAWSQVGPRFWGGALFGLGIGLLLAAVLIQVQLQSSAWVGILGIVLAGIGQIIALRAVRSSRRPEET